MRGNAKKRVTTVAILAYIVNLSTAYNPGTPWRTSFTFAVVKDDGSIEAWGDSRYGGSAPSGLSNVKAVYSTTMALAALKTDGTVEAWGSTLNLYFALFQYLIAVLLLKTL